MTATWRCRAVDSEGRSRRVERAAGSERELARVLAGEGLSPIECVPIAARAARKLSSRDLLAFTTELDLLFARDLGIRDAVRVLGTINSSAPIMGLVASLAAELAKGRSLTQALAEYGAESGAGFPPLYLGLVRIGELTGTLKSVMPRLAAYLEDRKRLRDKLFGALAYPALVLCVLVAGMALLTAYVLPTFIGVAESLSNSGAAGIRTGLIGFQAGFAALLLAFPAIAAAFAAMRSRRGGRAALDRAVLRLPLVGGFALGVEMRKLCFALETLLASGYSADAALAESVGVCGNVAVASALSEASERTTKGERLSGALRDTKILPATFCSWIAVGEEAQDLGGAFRRLRGHYDREFDKASNALISLMEPALIVVAGVLLFAVVIRFIGPIYGLIGGMQ
jgi:type II secretory pathway component PulF